MRRLLTLLLLLLCLPYRSFSANTHGSADEARERGAWFSDAIGPFIASGCLPSVPGASLTFGAFACAGYVQGSSGELVYAAQAAATVTLSNTAGTHWIALTRDVSTAFSGWTRRAGTQYIVRQVTNRPAESAGMILIAKATVAAGIISAVEDIRIPSSYARAGVYALTDPLYGGVCDGSTDNATAFAAAIAGVPSTGGIITVPPSLYGICMIGSSVTLSKKVIIRGSGMQDATANAAGATIIKKTAGATGPAFIITTPNVALENLIVDATAGSTGNGIDIRQPMARLTNVSVFNQAQDGIRVGQDGVTVNCNLCRLDNIVTSNNGRHGLHIKHNLTSGQNANACTVTHILAQANTQAGIRLENALFNVFVGGASENNGTYGFSCGPNCGHNRVFGVDLQEGNTTQDLFFEGTTSALNQVENSIQDESKVTDNSGTSLSNYVTFEQSGGGGQWLRGIYAINLSGTGSGYLRNSRTNGKINVIVEDEANTDANAVLIVSKNGLQIGSQSVRATNSAAIKAIYRGTGSLVYGSIASGGESSLDVTVTGAVAGNNCICTPGSEPGIANGLIWNTFAVTDACRVKMVNATAGALTPTSVNWNCSAIKY